MSNEKKIIRTNKRDKPESLSTYLAILSSHRDELRERYNVKGIGIFGSVARGESKRRSDVDVLVEYKKLPDLLEFINLERYLESIFQQKVDLVERGGIRKELRDRILREVQTIQI